jgi:predicted amidohydrolase
MKEVRIVLYQKPLGITIPRRDSHEMREYRPNFVCFPEYFFVNRRLGNHGQTPHNFKRQLKRMETLSRGLNTVVIGGTTPEPADNRLYNTCFVYDRGENIGYYRKRNLFFAEADRITAGDSFRVFKAFGITFGVLICADVFADDSFLAMKELGAEIVFIPTFSPKRVESMEEKFKRDNDIFVRGARLSDAVIVKVCSVRSEFREFLQARSLVADKRGVIYRVKPEEEEKSMIIKQEVQL